jgi:NADH-quinone oxidoreductase subunit K
VKPGLEHFLVVAALLFVAGVFCALTRRGVSGFLIGSTLVLSAAGLNLAAFDRFGATSHGFGAQVLALVALVAATGQGMVAFALGLQLRGREAAPGADEHGLD